MAEVEKGPGKLTQLAIRGNYRAVAASDLAKAHSRNIAQRQLVAPDFARGASKKNTSLEPAKEGRPIFLENARQNEATSFDTETQGLKPRGCAWEIAKSANA